MLLPPRSPDLDPLDYGVFGAAKRRLREERVRGKVGFDEACKHFMEDLQALDATRIIEQLPLRLQACIESRGAHIEQKLAELKRASGGEDSE